MPETFFTSDHHFGHAKIIEHCKRPFADVDEMTEVMIERWNAVVGPHDDVWHLGDFAYRMRPEAVERVFRRLRGRKHLIVGNHDDKHVLRLAWSSEPKDRRAVRVPGEALPVICDHYAMRTWPKAHYGAVHLYGHSHGALPGMGRSVDVGVDVWDFRPVRLEELRPVLERQQAVLDDARGDAISR
jgi:calcineurin-like phosphoesterase family protein